MNTKIYEAATTLREVLEKDPLIVALKKFEEQIAKDEDLQKLFKNIKSLETKLNGLLEYRDLEHPEVKEVRQRLFLEKYTLDTNPVMKEYNVLFKEVSVIYTKITKELNAIFNRTVRKT